MFTLRSQQPNIVPIIVPLTPVANLPPVSLIPLSNLPPMSLIPVVHLDFGPALALSSDNLELATANLSPPEESGEENKIFHW